MKSLHENKDTMPRTQFHCVWMSAGVLSYQLCDREFDCDNCPLDTAMRKLFQRRNDSFVIPVQPASNEGSGEEYLYSENHCWVRLLPDGLVRVGLEPMYASILVAPRAVVLPAVGQQLRRNHSCLWIVVESRTIPVSAPVRGTVVAANLELGDHPYGLSSQPFTSWLCDLQTTPAALRAAHLLRRKEAGKLYDRDMKRLRAMLADALQNTAAVGRTLHDGGEYLSDARSMLGPERYYQVVCRVFR